MDARELARRDFGALHEKYDILQAGACTGGSPTPVDAGGARHYALPARDLVRKHGEHQAGERGVEGDHARELARERQHTFREGREAAALEKRNCR